VSGSYDLERFVVAQNADESFARIVGKSAARGAEFESDESITRARRLVEEAESVAVLTGAGVSTASGIPDYRGPEGVWTKDPDAQRLSNINDFVASHDVRVAAWQRALHQRTFDAQPNAAHLALVTFEHAGKLRAIITQNVDGLHLKAGSSPNLVREVHGYSRTTRCLSCGVETPTKEILTRVAAGDVDPHCEAVVLHDVCGGLLKTAVVSFGQPLPADVFADAELIVKTSDLLICVGSTLTVRPVSGLVDKAIARHRRLVIINAEATPFDGDADVVVRGDIPVVLGRVLGVS
jgi:NAD-dependent deacetylase